MLKQLRVNRDTKPVHDRCLCGARIRYVRSLSQAFAKLFSRGCQVSVLRAGDAHRDDVIDSGQRSIKQSFSAHVFENRARERDASTSFNFSDEELSAAAFVKFNASATARKYRKCRSSIADHYAKTASLRKHHGIGEIQTQLAAKSTQVVLMTGSPYMVTPHKDMEDFFR